MKHPALEAMRAAGAPGLAVRTFALHLRRVLDGADGWVPEAGLAPVGAVPQADALDPGLAAVGRAHLHRAVILKLNGGLGTSMGLRRCKALLPVKHGRSFLAWTVDQARAAGAPLLLLDSFATRADALAALDELPPLPGNLPRDLLQHRVPKLDAGTLTPVEWPDPELRWCPPGHGDLYTALQTRGLLDALLGAGVRWAFVSNADNLGATLDPVLLGHVVTTGAPFLMEVAARTPADRKGGHLARRDGRLVLRERAQCPPADLPAFEAVERHRLFNTNNLWIDLQALATALVAHDGVLPLPTIQNRKPVDPRDRSSTPVIQLETAAGAALEAIPGAAAVAVARDRFCPVKTTADLLWVRSDATEVRADGRVVPVAPRARVVLDPVHHRLLPDLDRHFPAGAPSLRGCTELVVEGPWTFGRGVVVRGRVHLRTEAPQRVPDGAVLEG